MDLSSGVNPATVGLLLDGVAVELPVDCITQECVVELGGKLAPGLHTLRFLAADNDGNISSVERDIEVVASLKALECVLLGGTCDGIQPECVRNILTDRVKILQNVEADGDLNRAMHMLEKLEEALSHDHYDDEACTANDERAEPEEHEHDEPSDECRELRDDEDNEEDAWKNLDDNFDDLHDACIPETCANLLVKNLRAVASDRWGLGLKESREDDSDDGGD